MLINESKIRVRYAETDQMGVVHHSTYLVYFEIGRTEMLRKLGPTYRNMEDEGIMLPVISVECNFLGPARYDDELTIRTILKEVPGVKVTFFYEIVNNNIVICKGKSVLAFTDSKTRKPVRPPKWFVDLFKESITK